MDLRNQVSRLERHFNELESDHDNEAAELFLAQLDAAMRGEAAEYDLLPKRLKVPLTLHEKQQRLWNTTKRRVVVPAGRRSGKTEIAKRYLVKMAIGPQEYEDAWYVAAAPTRDQAKRIYWRHLKRMVPKDLIHSISESELSIILTNGAEISVVGMDVPERIEGRPLNGIVLDEYGNMKPEVWQENILPMLAERKAWAWFIGVPEGRNHYYELTQDAKLREDWDVISWTSAEVLPLYLGVEQAAAEIAAALAVMDPLTFAQEFNADFISFAGAAYHCYNDVDHVAKRGLPDEYKYDPHRDLILMFDFNVAPGVAMAGQERGDKTAIQGEVYIPRNSTTPAVCRKIAQLWGGHKGIVKCYGDSTGGIGGSAKVAGSDWDIIKAELKPVFGDRLRFRVPKDNPRERVRVNAVNSRLRTTDGKTHLIIDGPKCPMTIRDLEGVRLLEGGSGEIDKDHDDKLTHLTDALGYYICKEHPVVLPAATFFAQV